MEILRIGFALAVALSSISVEARADAFDATTAGRTCVANNGNGFYGTGNRLECTYKVGRDLEFVITDIGRHDAGILFIRSNLKGDYYAKFGLKHGCVIVTGDLMALDWAFVSPRDGFVYRTWEHCQTAVNLYQLKR